MNITIIQYRANGSDYCRGCFMGSSESDHEIHVAENIYDAANYIAQKLYKDHHSDREYCGWESTILIDGIPTNEYYGDDYAKIEKINNVIFSKANELFSQRLADDEAEAKKKADEEKERKKQDKIKKEEEKVIREKKKLAELKQKYEA